MFGVSYTTVDRSEVRPSKPRLGMSRNRGRTVLLYQFHDVDEMDLFHADPS